MTSLQREEVGENPARSRHCERMPKGSNPIRLLQVRPPLQPFFFSYGTRIPLESFMNHPAASASFSGNNPAFDAPMPIPVREVLPWAIFIGLLALLAIYFVGAEQGATSIFQGMYIHEFVHDGRHLLGFPCH
jgi:hypothetical protein